jgi:hypothetical protein
MPPAAMPLRSAPPVTPAAPAASPRGNKLALVGVACISLVVGGLGVRFAGARASSPNADTTEQAAPLVPTPILTAAPPVVPTAAIAEAADASMPEPAVAPRASSSSRPAHPPDKKRVVPKGAPSSSDRPFMPAEL